MTLFGGELGGDVEVKAHETADFDVTIPISYFSLSLAD